MPAASPTTWRSPACRPASRRCRAAAATADALVEAMAQDKKVRDGALTFILARGIGQSFIAPGIDRSEVRAFLQTSSPPNCAPDPAIGLALRRSDR